jgi:hypothetical protein
MDPPELDATAPQIGTTRARSLRPTPELPKGCGSAGRTSEASAPGWDHLAAKQRLWVGAPKAQQPMALGWGAQSPTTNGFGLGRLKPNNNVGQGRLELPTSRLSGVRSNHLSYWPGRPFEAHRQTPRSNDRATNNWVSLSRTVLWSLKTESYSPSSAPSAAQSRN